MADNGIRALGYLDQILALEPKSDQHLFSQCTACLAGLRDAMIDGNASRTGLEHVNAVISVVLAGHFPLGKVPWDELRKARKWLDDAVRDQP